MAHPDERLLEPLGRAGFEHLVEQGNERGDALEREPLRPRVAAVEDLFEQIGPDEALEHRARVDLGNRLLHPLLHPLAACRVGDVHELGADRAAVPLPGALGLRPAPRQIRVRPGRRETERVGRRLEVSPPPEGVEDPVLLRHPVLLPSATRARSSVDQAHSACLSSALSRLTASGARARRGPEWQLPSRCRASNTSMNAASRVPSNSQIAPAPVRLSGRSLLRGPAARHSRIRRPPALFLIAFPWPLTPVPSAPAEWPSRLDYG